MTAVARETAARANLVAAIFDPRQLAHSGHVARASLAEPDPEAMLARFRDGQVVPLAVAGDVLRALPQRGAPVAASRRRRWSSTPTNAGAPSSSARASASPPVLAQRGDGAHVGPGVVGVAWLQPPGSEVQRRSNAAS